MNVEYRQLFLKDLKKLRKQPVYQKVRTLAFATLPDQKTFAETQNVKAMVGQPNRYRIRVGNWVTIV